MAMSLVGLDLGLVCGLDERQLFLAVEAWQSRQKSLDTSGQIYQPRTRPTTESRLQGKWADNA